MQSAPVDDSAVFRRLMRNVYPNIESFKADFRNFQKETCTSFYIYSCETYQVAKKRGIQLPKGVPYNVAKFCCVHRKRKSDKSSRYPNLECGVFVTIRYAGSCYCVVSWSMKHSHSFQVGNEGFYVRNRRLTHDQEAHVFHLMGSFRNTSELREYVWKKFNRRLTRQDFFSIRSRLTAIEKSTEPEQVQCLQDAHGNSEIIVPPKSDRLAESERVAKGMVVALSMLGEQHFQYLKKQVTLLNTMMSIRPDVQVMFRLPEKTAPFVLESQSDVYKVCGTKKQRVKLDSVQVPSTSWAGTARSESAQDTHVSRRKSALTSRNIDEGDMLHYTDQLHTAF